MRTVISDIDVTVESSVHEMFQDSELVLMGMMLGRLGAIWMGTSKSEGDDPGEVNLRVTGRLF